MKHYKSLNKAQRLIVKNKYDDFFIENNIDKFR